MIYREQLEQRELDTLSEFAAKSVQSKGRRTFEEPCPIRTDFQGTETGSYTLKRCAG